MTKESFNAVAPKSHWEFVQTSQKKDMGYTEQGVTYT